MPWTPATLTFWALSPTGPLALPIPLAARFIDGGDCDVFLGTYAEAAALMVPVELAAPVAEPEACAVIKPQSRAKGKRRKSVTFTRSVA